MALRQQLWRPDTCANPATGDVCEFIEEWDDAVDPVARTHTFVQANKLCSFHAVVAPLLAFDRVYQENRRKNVTFLMAKTIKADLDYAQFSWSYSSNGLLTVNLGSLLTNNQKNNLQAQADIQFGPGKVLVL